MESDGIYIDCTLGGSHSEGILKHLSEKGRLISIDQDTVPLLLQEKIGKYGKQWSVFKIILKISTLFLFNELG